MNSLRQIVAPAYLVAALLILFPITDSVLSVFPPQLGEVSWRFGAVGLFSRALMTPLLGILIANAIALIAGHRRVVRGLAILNGVVCAALFAVVPFFVLDALQMRAIIVDEARFTFDVASWVALAKISIGAIVAGAFAVQGWKLSRRQPQRVGVQQRARPESGGLMGRLASADF
jgi:hypothetical protein